MTDRQRAKKLMEEVLPQRRWEHSVGVAKTAEQLAQRYNLSQDKAFCAGLLHDLLKYFPEEPLLHWAKKSAIILDNAFLEHRPVWHGFAAAGYLRENEGIDDAEFLQAIAFHSTGRAGMSLFEKILFVADMIEPNRDYYDVQTVRLLAEASLDQAILYVLKYNIGKVLNAGEPIGCYTWEAYNELSTALKPSPTKEELG